MPTVKPVMAILGALYMIYLAYKIISSKPAEGTNAQPTIGYFTGIMLQFANPKLLIYLVTVTSNFIVPFVQPGIGYLLVSIFFGAIGITSLLTWGAFGSFFKRFLTNNHRPFSYAMGLLLLYSAVSISGVLEYLK
jgi:threonine/homoserine/homoserine lactone efflux protein